MIHSRIQRGQPGRTPPLNHLQSWVSTGKIQERPDGIIFLSRYLDPVIERPVRLWVASEVLGGMPVGGLFGGAFRLLHLLHFGEDGVADFSGLAFSDNSASTGSGFVARA